MNILTYCIAVICLFWTGLVEAQTKFAFSRAAEVKEDFSLLEEKDACPPEYKGMKGRYIELGSLVPKSADEGGQGAELNPFEVSSLAYLKRVAEIDPEARFPLEPLGLLSPYVTEAKKGGIRTRIQALHQDLLMGKSPKIVGTKQDEDMAVSLFLFPRKSNPFEFIGGVVALLKEGEEWKASATPAVFANTNLPYEGDKRMRAGALENWATKELTKQLSEVTGKRVKEANDEIVNIRLGLKGNNADMLLVKLAEGMVKRDPVKMAAIMNLEGGAGKVMEFLNKEGNSEQSSSYLNRLCGRRSVVVPLDPKSLELTKEQEEEFQRGLQEEKENRGDETVLEQNGEGGKECALGVILVKPAMRYNARQQVTFYVGLEYCSTWKNAPAESALNKKEDDTAPLLHFTGADSSIQDWVLGRFAYSTTTSRIARDFHRSYPAFQFTTPQEAVAFILPALQGEHFTELLRCLPPQNFTTGIALLDYIGSLIKLSEQAGSTLANNDRNSKTDWRLSDLGSEAPPKTFENVVIYERPTEAIVCWTVSSGDQGRGEQMSSLLLRKHGDYWYLLLPSDPSPGDSPSLGAVASNLLAAYRVTCQKGVYLKAGVLEPFKAEKLPEKEAIEAAQKWSERVNDMAEKKDLMEMMKHCLTLEDTPQSRQRMGEAIQEHISNYGHEKVTSTMRSWNVKETCFFETIFLGEARAKEGKMLAPRVLDAPMTVYVYQKGGIKWVPELTLFAPTSPVRKMLSNKRLNMAKKLLSPQVYAEYLAGYKAHCQKIIEGQESFEKL